MTQNFCENDKGTYLKLQLEKCIFDILKKPTSSTTGIF